MKFTCTLLIALHFCFALNSQLDVSPGDSDVASFNLNELTEKLDSSNGVWFPFFRGEHVLTGIYRLEAGMIDRQQPHDTDEVYYVIKGAGKFEAGEERMSIAAGTILFVKADVEHQFYDIKEDIVLLVFFDQ